MGILGQNPDPSIPSPGIADSGAGARLRHPSAVSTIDVKFYTHTASTQTTHTLKMPVNYEWRQRCKRKRSQKQRKKEQKQVKANVVLSLNYKRLQRCNWRKERHKASINQQQDLHTLLNYKRLQRCKWEHSQKHKEKQRKKEHQKESIEQLKANAFCQVRGCVGTVKKDFQLKKDGTLCGLCQSCCNKKLRQEQRNTEQFAYATRPRRSS